MEGARPLVLDILTHADARTLLAARLSAERLTAEPRAHAQQAWQQALDILGPVGEAAASQIREKLRRIR